MHGDYQWWGFRIRVPLGYDPPLVTRGESMAFAMAVAALLSAVATTVLVALPALRWIDAAILSVAIVGLAAATAWLVPVSLLEKSGVAAFMILAREKGDAGRRDGVTGLVAIALAALSLLRINHPFGPPLLASLLAAAAASFLLAVQQSVCSAGRRWSLDIPDWLKEEFQERGDGGEETPGKVRDGIIPADERAQGLYSFRAGEQEYKVGVRISEELIASLRAVNCEHKGILYTTDTQAAVLTDRPPVENLGRAELERLAAQILSIARKHRMGKLALANATLGFVQLSIPYGFDEDTTGAFPGGPFVEYGRMAVETLHDTVGDCECTSILCAALLRYLDFDVALLMVATPAGHHAAVGLSSEVLGGGETAGLDLISATDKSGKLYLYGETASESDDLKFGAIPANWKAALQVKNVVAIEPPHRRVQRAGA